MLTSSAKAKGRRLQQLIAKSLLEVAEHRGLVADDIASRGMGQNGEDIILSPAARKAGLDLYIEAKNCEALNVSTTFFKHYAKYKAKQGMSLLIHAKNKTEALVTMRFSDYLSLLRKTLN